MAKSNIEKMIEAVGKGKPQARAKAAKKLARTLDARGIPVILKALTDKNVIVRRGAAEALINNISQTGMKEIFAALKDDDSIVRTFAAYSLVNFQDMTVTGPLLEALEDTEPSVRAKAAFSLGRVPGNTGGNKATPEIIAALVKHMGDIDPEVAYESAYSLVILDDLRGYETILAQLDSKDANVRCRAAGALLLVPHVRNLETLTRQLENPDEEVRALLIESIFCIQDPRIGVALEIALDDPAPDNRVRALYHLEDIQYEKIIEVAERFVNDQNESLRSVALGILSRNRPEMAIGGLYRSLDNENLEIRWHAMVALLEMENPGTLGPIVKTLTKRENYKMWYNAGHRLLWLGDNITPFLATMLKDTDRDVRTCAATGLGAMRDPSTVPSLLDALKDKEWEVRAAAARSLEQISDESSIQGLIDALKDPKEEVRATCLRALRDFHDKVPVHVYIDSLKDRSSSVKQEALYKFGNEPEPQALDALLGLLDDEDPEIVRSLGIPIGALKEKRSVPELIKRLSQDKGRMADPSLRETAALALGMIGEISAVGPLVDAMGDAVYPVRREALRALVQLDPAVAVDEAIKALKDPSWEFRMDATMTLMSNSSEKALPPLREAVAVEQHETVKASMNDAIRELEQKKA